MGVLEQAALRQAKGQAFALATVVRTVSVTAAKAGAKALIGPDGSIEEGWIGGGCARAAVVKAARQCMADGQSRLVSIAPKDALLELGAAPGEERGGVFYAKNSCPSQGTMDVFVEPVLPSPRLLILGASPVAVALARLAQEDPTFKVHTDPDSGQTIISGMGELHLEIIVDRMMREYKVEANVGKPQVAYRETIRKHSEAEGKYIRQTGGRGQYGHAKIYLDPQPPGTGYEFVNDVTGGSVPKEFIKPIDQGIQEALEGGILAGYPMVDVKATLYDGSYHDVDSNEMAFKIAGSMAFKEAARKASPVLLEPVMAVEVVTPEDYAGTIMGDLSSRRGRIEGMEHRAGSQVIKAIVPLAEMFGYATHMRSSTQGRAEYSMHFARYEEAPRSVAEEIIAKVQGTTK